jgi:hypothetical protein
MDLAVKAYDDKKKEYVEKIKKEKTEDLKI